MIRFLWGETSFWGVMWFKPVRGHVGIGLTVADTGWTVGVTNVIGGKS